MHAARLFLIIGLSLVLSPAVGDSLLLDTNHRDWAQLGELSRSRHIPVVILVTDEDCGYCERLKEEVLLPMAREGRLEGRALVRELSMRTGGKLLDFDGERIRARIFLGRYNIFASPTLLFLDAAGHALHKPLIGYNGRDEYSSLLLEALDKSLSGMAPSDVAGNADG